MAITPAIDAEEVVKLTQNLISIESHEEARGREAKAAKYLLDWYKGAGVEVVAQPVEGKRVNIIAKIPGVGHGPSLMLNGHLDTVPAGSMKRPFDPYIEEGVLHGRGACDMKGAVAAMCCAVKGIHQGGIRLDGDLYFSGVVGEETGSPGIRELIDKDPLSDYAIVGEPTGLKIGLAHKGFIFIEVEIGGRSGHGSRPEQGVNAVSFAARFVTRLEECLGGSLQEKSHPLLGHSTLSVGKIAGGTKPNVIPDHCTVQIDYRYLPGETSQGVIASVREVLDGLHKDFPGITYDLHEIEQFSLLPHAPLEASEEGRISQTLATSIKQELGREPEFVGLPYWSDGAALAQHGVETIICGPGDISKAHGPQESVEVKQLKEAAFLYMDVALALLSK
jgi:acetylornithine deacetylase/succinyl-diaminopimelate desuccinylase